MSKIDIADFRTFCKTLEGKTIPSSNGKYLTLLKVGKGLRWSKGSSTSSKGVETYLEKYNSSGSLNPKDYNGIVVGRQKTQHGHQIVPLIKLYLESRSKPTTMKVISLVSGGPDSILATHRLLKQGHEVLMMFADYDQPAAVQEREASENFYCLFLKRFPKKVEFHEIAVRLNGPKKVESAWGRTLMLLGSALAYNYSQCDNSYNAVAFGGHLGDKGPDVRPENKEALEKLVQIHTKGTVKWLNPIADVDIEELGKEFKRENLPLDMTYNCYWGLPCGYRSPHDTYRCQGCRRKVVSMKAAGYSDEECRLPNTKIISYQSPLAEPPDY
jgi:7-cyano-7-deazaguanine synthase in queuosine biosynthesis